MITVTVQGCDGAYKRCLINKASDLFIFLSSAGWLLDITKLRLGENIGEGEFGGELHHLVFI